MQVLAIKRHEVVTPMGRIQPLKGPLKDPLAALLILP